MPRADITVSVVSHRQNALVNQVVADLHRHCADGIHIVITENVPDGTPFRAHGATDIIRNARPKGFGANHNAAFARCNTPYFCILNPDIRINHDPFPSLVEALARPGAAVAGPLVRDPSGRIEDSARRFPTPGILVRKVFASRALPDYPADHGVVDVDWLAGMSMLFRAESYRRVSGFDESYFLYYEDVDICRRIRAAGYRVVYQPAAEVIHDARRGSRRDPALAWQHALSAMRFFLTK
jgi:GT2 family glycosyltransferase